MKDSGGSDEATAWIYWGRAEDIAISMAAGVSSGGSDVASLGQKIIGSAKGLTCSTFAGDHGIGSGLRGRDPFGVGKSISAPCGRRGVAETNFPDVAIRSSSATASIQDRAFRQPDDGDVQSAEDEFQGFMKHRRSRLSDDAVLFAEVSRQMSLSTSKSGQITSKQRELQRQTQQGVYDYVDQTFDADRENSEPIWKRHSEGEVVVQENGRPEWRWRHEWRRLQKGKEEEEEVYDQLPEIEPIYECDLTKAMSESFEIQQSAAIARLDQVRGHLALHDTTPSDLGSWKADWQIHLERCDWTVEREEDRLSPEPEQREPERYYFHCPYRECHHRLLRQNENLSLAIRQRVCVHDGCGYVSQTVDEWLKHVTGAHHGVQDGPSEHTSRLEGDRRGLCPHQNGRSEGGYCEQCSGLNREDTR